MSCVHDTDDHESLDGAEIADHAPEPDDEELRTRLPQNPRATVRAMPEVRQRQQRTRRDAVAHR